MTSMKRKWKLSKPKVWPLVNCLYDQLLQAKEALEEAKVALRKAKQKLHRAIAEHQDAMGSNCSHGSEFLPCGETRCVAQNHVPRVVVPRVEIATVELASPLMIQHVNRHPCFDLIK